MEPKKYTREQIAQRIVDHNDYLVVYMNKVYRLNSWIKQHPGGEMVIMHMIGKVRTNDSHVYCHRLLSIFRMLPMRSMPIIRTVFYAINCHCSISVMSTMKNNIDFNR
jgi:hypothetical protein